MTCESFELFPPSLMSVGSKVEHATLTHLRRKRLPEYLACMASVLDEDVRYSDPACDLRGKKQVLAYLESVAPRTAKSSFDFQLLTDQPSLAVWCWTIELKVRFARSPARIDGLVYAKAHEGKIVEQREYFDPMQSLSLSSLTHRLYRFILRNA